MELFLFLTCFLQQFTFQKPDNFNVDMNDTKEGAIRQPPDYQIIIKERD